MGDRESENIDEKVKLKTENRDQNDRKKTMNESK